MRQVYSVYNKLPNQCHRCRRRSGCTTLCFLPHHWVFRGYPLGVSTRNGNRIYGCDDCQLVCPWNRLAPLTQQSDFHRRQSLNNADLVVLFEWDEATFLKNMEGSAIRRIGHQQWRRNLIIAMGNAPYSPRIIDTLQRHLGKVNYLMSIFIGLWRNRPKRPPHLASMLAWFALLKRGCQGMHE